MREQDEAAARALVREHGYRELDPAYERNMRAIALSPQLDNVARTLRKDELDVDLHRRFGPNPPPALAAERLVARAAELPGGAGTIRFAHPVDAVLTAVHSALRSSFVPENAVRDLCDLALWWEDTRVAAVLPELLEAARGARLATSLLAAWAYLLRRDPEHQLGRGHASLGRRTSRGRAPPAARADREPAPARLVRGPGADPPAQRAVVPRGRASAEPVPLEQLNQLRS